MAGLGKDEYLSCAALINLFKPHKSTLDCRSALKLRTFSKDHCEDPDVDVIGTLLLSFSVELNSAAIRTQFFSNIPDGGVHSFQRHPPV